MVDVLSDLDFKNSARPKNIPTPSSDGDCANKKYVDDSIIGGSGGMVFQGGFDASTGSFPSTVGIKKGWYYLITTAGTIDGISFQIGDQLFAQIDSPSSTIYAGNWVLVNSSIPDASEAVSGLIKLATQAEVNTGTVSDEAVTPATLQQKITNTLNSQTYTTQIGDTVNTSFTITHNLANQNVQAIVRQSSSPFEQIMVTIGYLDANNVVIGPFVNPPNTNQFTVVIKK
jgi:hypothetical protein